MIARTYAKLAGIVIVLIGIGGLILGEQSLLGVLNIDIAEDIVHLVTGGLMAVVGFRGSDRAVRLVVGGLGVVYLLVGVLGIFVPDMFGLLPNEYKTVLDNIIHLTLGVLGIVIGFFIGRRSDSRLAH
ncbi:MAG: DUF4383 domain-containing protein [Geodermatophilaceae bacterium]